MTLSVTERPPSLLSFHFFLANQSNSPPPLPPKRGQKLFKRGGKSKMVPYFEYGPFMKFRARQRVEKLKVAHTRLG